MGDSEIVAEVKRLRTRVEALEQGQGSSEEVTALKKEVEKLTQKLEEKAGIDWDAPIV